MQNHLIQVNLAKMLLELKGRLWQPQKLESLRAGACRIIASRRSLHPGESGEDVAGVKGSAVAATKAWKLEGRSLQDHCIQANLAKMLLELWSRPWLPPKLESSRAGARRIIESRQIWPRCCWSYGPGCNCHKNLKA